MTRPVVLGGGSINRTVDTQWLTETTNGYTRYYLKKLVLIRRNWEKLLKYCLSAKKSFAFANYILGKTVFRPIAPRWKKPMFLRLLAIIALWSAITAALVACLAPSKETVSAPAAHPHRNAADGFQQTLDRLNAAFRQQWKTAGLHAAQPADELTIARRLSLALAGTTPSLEEIRTLEATPSEERIPNYVDHLLDDRRTSDYLAERLARTLVGDEFGSFLVFRRRRFVNWLADQLHEARPYDAVIRDILTSEGLWTNRPETNFFTATIDEASGQPDPAKLAVRVSRALLGVRLDCAQCHDHPFDERWKQSHFESLAAFFGSTGFGKELAALRGIQDLARPYRVGDEGAVGEKRIVAPFVPFNEDLMPSNGTPRNRLATWLTDRENKAFARVTVNRFWALLFGRSLVEPVDSIPLDDTVPTALDLLAQDFADSSFDLRRLIRLCAASAPFQLDSRLPSSAAQEAEPNLVEYERCWAVFPLTRLRGEQVIGSVVQASRLTTIDHESHILLRLVRFGSQADFLKRYGDAGAQELEAQSGTIPQRLLMMNGQIVHERTKPDLVTNAATRIAALAPDDKRAVEVAYLTVLTRRPSAAEMEHFVARLKDKTGEERSECLADLSWALENSTEFSWNH